MQFKKSAPLVVKGLLMAGLLASCQNGDLAPSTDSPQTGNTHSSEKTAFTPQLLQDGQKELKYYDQYSEYVTGRKKLWKVIDLSETTEYQYNGPTITAQRKKNTTGVLLYTVTYQLDALGRCVQSHSTETNKTLKYEYGQLGRLTKIYNNEYPNERQEFNYCESSTTLLKSIYYFDKANVKTREINFSYVAPGGGNQIENKYQINPAALGTTSEYLPVFGPFHAKLATHTSDENLQVSGSQPITRMYSYVLNASGYVKTILVDLGNVQETRNLKYTVQGI